MCGPFELEPHRCAQNNEINKPDSRYAQCQCAQGYLLVPHPDPVEAAKGVQICEKYCKNGNVPVGWDPLSPEPCICDRSTGFDTANNSPRCDHAICQNQGTFKNGACECKMPWTNVDVCRSNSCGAGNRVVPWLSSEATSLFQCSCTAPSRSRFSLAPFDCASTICGSNGYLNPFYNSNSLPIAYCVCNGKSRTSCVSNEGCNYCSETRCLNGGRTSSSEANSCVCTFPFYNGPQGLCELSRCNANGTASYQASTCVCKPGITGPSCNVSVCFNNATFVPATGICSCRPGFVGLFCDVRLSDVLPPTPVVVSSTGTSTPSVSSTAGVQEPPVVQSSSDQSTPFWLLLLLLLSFFALAL